MPKLFCDPYSMNLLKFLHKFYLSLWRVKFITYHLIFTGDSLNISMIALRCRFFLYCNNMKINSLAFKVFTFGDFLHDILINSFILVFYNASVDIAGINKEISFLTENYLEQHQKVWTEVPHNIFHQMFVSHFEIPGSKILGK